MNIAILAFSAIGAITGTASLVIMYKTRQGLVQFGADLRTDIDNVKSNTNKTIAGVRDALNGVEL